MRRGRRLHIVGGGRETRLRLVGDWDDDPLDALCETARLSGAVEKLQRHLVEQAQTGGASWAQIGTALGISKQSAWERFSPPRDRR